jgi:hypothetical protein
MLTAQTWRSTNAFCAPMAMMSMAVELKPWTKAVVVMACILATASQSRQLYF